MDEIDAIIDGVLHTEQGYVNHPADRGGATNWGITLDTLRADGAFYDRDYDNDGDVDAQDVKLLPRVDAAAILRMRYYERPGFSRIESPLIRTLCTDASVNHGPAQAVKLLQQALGVFADGRLGHLTAGAANVAKLPRLAIIFLAERATLYGQIVTRDPVLARARDAGFRLQAENALGWSRRLADQLRMIK